MDKWTGLVVCVCATALQQACSPGADSEATNPQVNRGMEAAQQPTAAEAAAFVAEAEQHLARLGQYSERQAWVLQNFITPDTELLAAKASEQFTAAQVEVAGEAARFMDVRDLDFDTHRKLHMLRSGIVVPAPSDAAKTAEQAAIGAKLSGMYGKGSYCRADGACLALGELEDIMARSRDPAELLEAWAGWRAVGPPMRALYARQVELANEGAAELGFADLGTMWRSGYDMNPAAFPGELDGLWSQVRPLYEALHCHVRAKLGEAYGPNLVPQDGPIPAHLLGNMWAQSWDKLYDLVAPPATAAGYDLTGILNERGFDAVSMVKTGEAFFGSLGFEPLPQTFWERSLFVKPRDRDVVCHPSAWTIDCLLYTSPSPRDS